MSTALTGSNSTAGDQIVPSGVWRRQPLVGANELAGSPPPIAKAVLLDAFTPRARGCSFFLFAFLLKRRNGFPFLFGAFRSRIRGWQFQTRILVPEQGVLPRKCGRQGK